MDPGDNSVQPGFVEGFTFGEIRIDNLGEDQYGHKNVQYAAVTGHFADIRSLK